MQIFFFIVIEADNYVLLLGRVWIWESVGTGFTLLVEYKQRYSSTISLIFVYRYYILYNVYCFIQNI